MNLKTVVMIDDKPLNIITVLNRLKKYFSNKYTFNKNSIKYAFKWKQGNVIIFFNKNFTPKKDFYYAIFCNLTMEKSYV